jgi:hypothetical protein
VAQPLARKVRPQNKVAFVLRLVLRVQAGGTPDLVARNLSPVPKVEPLERSEVGELYAAKAVDARPKMAQREAIRRRAIATYFASPDNLLEHGKLNTIQPFGSQRPTCRSPI